MHSAQGKSDASETTGWSLIAFRITQKHNKDNGSPLDVNLEGILS